MSKNSDNCLIPQLPDSSDKNCSKQEIGPNKNEQKSLMENLGSKMKSSKGCSLTTVELGNSVTKGQWEIHK